MLRDRGARSALVDGAIVLRPVAKGAPGAKAAAAPGPEQDATEPSGAITPLAARRKPGRPRKAAPAAEQPAPALELEAEEEPAPLAAEAVRSELRRKQQPPAPDLDQPWVLVRDPRPERRGADGHGEREKRPFGRVEVRKLGPGHGHNRGRPRVSGVPAPRS